MLVPMVIGYLVLVAVLVSILMTVTVLSLNYVAWRRESGVNRLNPLHVVLVSSAHLGYVVLAALYVVSVVDTAWWPAVVFGAASIATSVALVIAGKIQQRRIAVATARSTASTNVEE